MISRVSVTSFKSLVDVTVDLGLLNVFVGANGSGKSNLLDALGMLSAAADGKVEEGTLLSRGVRSGWPRLYPSAFADDKAAPRTLDFAAESDRAGYRVSLGSSPRHPGAAWPYRSEAWTERTGKIGKKKDLLKKSPKRQNDELGLAALEAVHRAPASPGMELLSRLQKFIIYSPTTTVLRGAAPEPRPHWPVGLSGGRLAEAALELMLEAKKNPSGIQVINEAMRLIDWAENDLAFIPVEPNSPLTIWFRDRYMPKERNQISGQEASEGALYVLFLAVLAVHPQAPRFVAIDNADHGLNPRLLTSLMKSLATWLTEGAEQRQMLLTSHNPAVLDGLPLQDDRVRLFTLDRDNRGFTVVRRIEVDERLLAFANKGWTLSRLWMNGLLGGVPPNV